MTRYDPVPFMAASCAPFPCDPEPVGGVPFESIPDSKGTILVVEDETELAEILEYNLRRSGYTVHSAADGLSACRQVAEFRPDLILLDLLLPDLDGWEICRLIRGHHDESIASTPVVMVTALGSLDHRLKGLELGADAYLPKPYSIREVLLKVGDLVTKRRKMNALVAELSSLRAGAAAQADIQRMLFHELRNQLMVLGGFSNLLARNHGSLTREKSQNYAEAIHRSSEFLGSLAEEFLLVRHLQTGNLDLATEPLSMERVVAETLLLYRPLLGEKDIRPEISADAGVPQARGHFAACRLIFSVLLENALKYGQKGMALQVGVESAGERVRLILADGGPGIAKEELERVFEKFYRGREALRDTRGTGLGLYFARTLAEAMGGSLEVRSRPDKGARFTLDLPRAAAAAGRD